MPIISVLPHDVMDKDFLQMTMHYNSVLITKKKHFLVMTMVNLTLGPYERNILWSRQQLCVLHCYHPNQEDISFLHTHVIR